MNTSNWRNSLLWKRNFWGNTKIIKPLTQALEIFVVGCVLPVLSLLKEKIIEFKEDRNIIHFAPLVTSLLNGLQKRFQSFHENNSCRLASISDPHFEFSSVTEKKKTEDIKLLKNKKLTDASAVCKLIFDYLIADFGFLK